MPTEEELEDAKNAAEEIQNDPTASEEEKDSAKIDYLEAEVEDLKEKNDDDEDKSTLAQGY